MEYQEVQTKKQYINLLNKVQEESKVLADNCPSIRIYLSIFNQLGDIKKILENNHIFEEEEI